ncbi:conserved hypothetical protein [Uncinocarpus reesii 1704]|uniref:SET domain-containing protein n=1 Tax=Uncinocarpus reesii (strain UAMH 1704) TaxID=336963 RepID=C4JP03_UNCRE|nr:uncharacterized protein UREG_03062 [Uncinocarpus reesii 1704]EEP78217.1 conserved hypothetical protein [Uncinocarpus reesii 1704]
MVHEQLHHPMDHSADDGFAEKSDGFMNWLKSHPGVRVSFKIRIADLRSNAAGRGVETVACEEIAQDEELFAIPENLVLSVQNSKLKDHLNFTDKELDSWLSLIVTMIYEYLHGGASRWSSYFAVLPTDFDTLMFWSQDELRELQGSSVLSKIGRQEADEMIMGKVYPLILDYPGLFPTPKELSSFNSQQGKEAILHLAHRMGTLIMAYAFDIENEMDREEEDQDGEDGYITDNEQETAKGMVPLADMLNADAHRNNARLFQEDGYFIMKSIVPISMEEEIFNDYGELPRADLLRRYGYITENYSPYDVVEISLEAICKVAGVEKNCPQLELLETAEILEDGYSLLRPETDANLVEAISPELIVLLRTLTMTPDNLNQMRVKGKLPKPQLDQASAKLLIEVLQSRQNDYPTTIAQDDELLHSTHSHRREMAIRVRKGEKEVLQLLLNGLHTYLGEIAESPKHQPKRSNPDTGKGRKMPKLK